MQRLQPGLKALISFFSESEEEEGLQRRKLPCLTRISISSRLSSETVVQPFVSPSSSSSSDEMAEKGSCDQEKGKEIEGEEEEEEEEYMSRRQKWRNEWRRREFPPPLPIVVKTENSACQDHVHWVLKKYSYCGSGSDEGGGQRVVIIEEKVKHHECFRAHRANGHLTLQLICIHDDDDVNHILKENETRRLETDSVVLESEEEGLDVEQEACETETEDVDEDVEVVVEEPGENEEKNGDTNRSVEEMSVMALASSMPELSLGYKCNGGAKCWTVSSSVGRRSNSELSLGYKCNKGAKCWTVSSSVGRRSISDLFRMQIPTIRPIHG